MRNAILLLLLFLSTANAEDISMNEIRELYKNSANKEDACNKLRTISEKYTVAHNSTITAYNACATMMTANHMLNPLKKWSQFTKGRELLEKCIKADNENVEIRYLRFTIQSNAPSFLGYNNSLETDKIFLLNAISNLKDLQLKQMIISFLKSSEHLTSKEKQNL